ncbi:MAG: glycosyltransferase family 2 protein [Agathobacter sp.]|nr:glycosyltransferase family 2 protein [Agathobacter sp.]
MREIEISVIMPSLNVVPYIRECVESVINQTFKNIEIICVDAGSTDGTLEVLKEFEKKDERIKVIVSDKKSYGYQVNLGIKEAKGRYIGIVETDDYIETNFYEKLFAETQQYEVDFVKMGFREFFKYNGNLHYYDRISNEAKNVAREYLDLKINRSLGLIELNHIWSAIYRRKFIVDNQIYLNETAGAAYQDTSFFILVGLKAKDCVYVDDYLYNYRIDNPSSSVKGSEKWKCILDEYQYVDKYIKEHEIDSKDNRRIITEIKLITYMWNYMRLTESAKKAFFDSIQVEMREIREDNILWNELSCGAREKYCFLTSKEKIANYEEVQEIAYNVYTDIIKNAINEKKYVVVGAGNYFRELCFLQMVLGKKFIKAVCDNSPIIQNTLVENYVVSSVEDIVEEEIDMYWIVANQKYGSHIMKQLSSLGIRQEKVILFDQVLGRDKLLEILYSFTA